MEKIFWIKGFDTEERIPVLVLERQCERRFAIAGSGGVFLNYADENSVKQLFNIFGLKKVSGIFSAQLNIYDRVANNYNGLARNFFKLYFNKYGRWNFKRPSKRTASIYKEI